MIKKFYIKELRIKNKENGIAKVDFDKGLNIIIGPSDTGKSYVFDCINFMLGATNPPSYIPESKSFNEVLMEIRSFDDKNIYTLRRDFIAKSKIYLYKSKIDESFQTNIFKELHYKHDKKNKDNISTFLLVCGPDS